MKKKNINFEPKLTISKKISIKALDFEKLPKKFVGSNFKANTFLNITRSSSNLGIENIPLTLNRQNNKKIYFVKPMTSRSRNQNPIRLNEIPKTSYINATPVQKMKQLSRNKNINNIFTQSIYQSYSNSNNNNSSAKCITNINNLQNTNSINSNSNNNSSINNIINNNININNYIYNNQYCQYNILNKMSSSKINSRNMSNSNILGNNSTYNLRIKNREIVNITSGSNIYQKFSNYLNNKNYSNYGTHELGNENKNSAPKNLVINGYKSISNGKNFRGTISNFGSLSFKKFSGIRVKKKKLLNRIEDQPFQNDKMRKLLNLEFFQNFYKLKTFVLWRTYTNEKSKDYQFYNLNEFLNNKIINYYYKNKLIRKYNQIKKEELTWKKLVIPQNSYEINEQNKGSILISLCENANITIQNVFFNNRIKNLNHLTLYSVSLYIFELMIKQIFSILSKIKYIFKYYYDEEKKAIIKKPSATDIKDLLLNLNKIIEKPNITNQIFQDFIINLSKYIANLDLNKIQTKPIISQYLDLYKGVNNINPKEIKISYQLGNILNDFSSLQIKDANFIINDIQYSIKECENNLFKFYFVEDFNDGDNFFILLYKVQPIKCQILNLYEKIKKLIDKTNKKMNDNMENLKKVQKNLDSLNECLNEIITEIESKFDENVINGKIQDIKVILPYLMWELIKNNITYINLFDGISKLEMNKNYLSSKKNKEIYNTYNKLYNNGYIDFDYIIYLCLYDKYTKLLEEKINEDANINKKLLYKILIYMEEMNNIYNKINIFENNQLTQTINIMQNIVIKNKNKIEKLKKIVINNENNNYCAKIKNSIQELYQDIISHYFKYDINKINNGDIKKNISFLEKVLFRQLKNINNKNIINNNKSNEKEIISKVNKFYITGDTKLLKDLLPDNRFSKKFLINDKKQKKEVDYPYPRFLFLSDEELSSLSNVEKISLTEISKYYNLIHEGQELEIKGITISKNIISGVQIYGENRKEYELFKLCNPINITSQNKNNKSALQYLSNIYKNIKKEIESSLTKQLIQSLNLFSKKDFHDWVNSTFNQIILCTLCLIFTHEISKILISVTENKKAKTYIKDYKLINEKFTNFLSEECEYINNIKDRINVTLTLISQMNIIDSLIKNDVHDINSFNWLKYIRHLWDKNKKEVIIECGGWANYQMKKINKYRYRLLLSPDTDKVFLFNSSCFREKSASIIKVINNKYNNNSYKQIFEEYCSLFWTDMINVNVYITPNEDMKKIFDICTTECSWIYITNMDLFKYRNDDNCINNLIYFSKFIQTIQQEVILNDIKSNEGEKMFCLMGCINVDDNIKNKCECLKGSCRILNFIKPDIDFYLNISFQIHKNINEAQNNVKINKNLSDILLKNEQVIRDKLKGFYFDFDYYNEFVIYILKSRTKNMINTESNLEDIFISFIHIYTNKFLEENEKSNIDDNIIIKYFESKKIIVDNERLQLFKYLFFITQNKVLKRNILIKGYSRHFMINLFKNFYFYHTNKKLSENDNLINENINIIYYNEDDQKHKNKNDKIDNSESPKIFNLPVPKCKILLKIFFDDFAQKLKKIYYILTEKYENKLIDYIYKVIRNNSNNTKFYRTLCNFNNWMNKLVGYLESNMKKINDIIFYNIINECLIISLGHEGNRLKSIIEASKEIIEEKIYKQFLDNINYSFNKNEEKYFYFDIESMIFRNNNNNMDFIKSYKKYLDTILNNSKIIYIFSEFFANQNGKELNNIFENEKSRIYITDDIDKLYNNDKNDNMSLKILKIFLGYDNSYVNQNIHMTSLNNNEKAKKVIEKANHLYLTKYLYILSIIDIKNYSIDELMFLYSIFDIDYKEIYNVNCITHPLDMIKKISNIFPKANYYINSKNKLLMYYIKNKILIGVNSINCNIEKDNIKSKSNNIFLNLSNDLCTKIIHGILLNIIKNNMQYKYLSKLIKLSNNSRNNQIDEIEHHSIDDTELNLISKMINDIYNIPSESSFNEKYQNSQQITDIFTKIFNTLDLPKRKILNDNYYNCRLVIQYIKYENIKEDSLDYKCLSSISDIFKDNTSKIKDISILINETLTNYKELISNKKEYINSKYYFFKQMKISAKVKENIYNSTLEKIYLSMSNHFLFLLLLTLEIMLNNFEISLLEKEFLLIYLKQNYLFPSYNVIKYKYETEQDNIKLNYIKENGLKLIEFYTSKTKSVDSNYLAILNKSLDDTNNKYFYTSNLKKIERDVDKLLYYITFVPEQSSSMFKYIINKYLLKIISFSKFNINDALRKPTTKENMIPITVNAFPSINVINFLCSLSAYYEINFYIVRNGNIYENKIIDNNNFGYQYLIDGGLFELIKEGMKKGYWILICEKIDNVKFMKIMWELYNNLDDREINLNKNFKIFFDEKLIEDNCQKDIENHTLIININNDNVDDLEAAHDIWVNVLEEKILTDSVMNQTQKDVLEINEDSSEDKTNLIGQSINYSGETKNMNINNITNSIISFKSMYNNNSINNRKNNAQHIQQNNLAEITNWTFLQNI